MNAKQQQGHPIFAAAYEWQSRRTDRRGLGERRAGLLGDLTGDVLEIGAGNGLNLAYYGRIAKVVAVEPDPHMIRRLERRAVAARFPVTIHPISAEQLPFPDESFDAVVACLTLCTIPEPRLALAELRRVLKRGGQFRFLEHVRGNDRRGPIFDVIQPAWSFFSGGCRPNRETENAIRAAGFEITAIERFSFGILPYIQGTARLAER